MLEVHIVSPAHRHLVPDRLMTDVGALGGRAMAGERASDDAFHLLGYRHGRLVAGACLSPSPGPSGRPEGAHWWSTVTMPSACGADRPGIMDAMVCGVMEYCVRERIGWVGVLQEAYWLPRWIDLGWEVEPLSLPEVIDGTSMLASLLRVTERGLNTARRAIGIGGPQIVQGSAGIPFLSTANETFNARDLYGAHRDLQ